MTITDQFIKVSSINTITYRGVMVGTETHFFMPKQKMSFRSVIHSFHTELGGEIVHDSIKEIYYMGDCMIHNCFLYVHPEYTPQDDTIPFEYEYNKLCNRHRNPEGLKLLYLYNTAEDIMDTVTEK